MKIAIFSFLICFKAFALDFSHLDPEGLIHPNLLRDAIGFFSKNNKIIKNKHFFGIIDFSIHNSNERFFILDLESGHVEKYLVAHGKNSDPDFDGLANFFSNIIDSNMSSVGFYLTAESYLGQNGRSLRLDGLSTTNSNARKRSIVIHSANYVYPSSKIGRSNGCPAVEVRFRDEIMDKLKNGALLYANIP